MERHILWSPWTQPGLEHLHITQQHNGLIADGLIIAVEDQRPFRLHYQIHCDLQWRLRSVYVHLLNNPTPALHLITDGEGAWTTEHGEAAPSLSGCLDVDISATPFTNTLPIRRLKLPPGSPATLPMAYIEVPRMQISVTEQRYTCLEATSSGGLYRFESLVNGVSHFTADLPVDEDGLVLDYPGLFRRLGAC